MPDDKTKIMTDISKTPRLYTETRLAADGQAELSGGDKAKLAQAAADIQAEDDTYWRAFRGELIDFFKNASTGVGGNYATGMVKDIIAFLSNL